MPDGAQTLFCQVGDPDRWDAVLVINQRDLDWVTEEQEVRLMFNNHPITYLLARFNTWPLESSLPCRPN